VRNLSYVLSDNIIDIVLKQIYHNTPCCHNFITPQSRLMPAVAFSYGYSIEDGLYEDTK